LEVWRDNGPSLFFRAPLKLAEDCFYWIQIVHDRSWRLQR